MFVSSHIIFLVIGICDICYVLLCCLLILLSCFGYFVFVYLASLLFLIILCKNLLFIYFFVSIIYALLKHFVVFVDYLHCMVCCSILFACIYSDICLRVFSFDILIYYCIVTQMNELSICVQFCVVCFTLP